MSEYQFVAFRTIDGPVTPSNLAYMRKQSSRAEITSWSFQNEYHYGDFNGNVAEMLRRGFDFHLHYANFGYRSLAIRLPHGLPNPQAARRYLSKTGVTFLADKHGPGGMLHVLPYFESGNTGEVYDLEDMVDRLARVRAEILEGDLRPLYLMHLALALDDRHDQRKALEGPVPAGLGELTDAQQALVEFYDPGKHFIEAAAECCPPLASQPRAEFSLEEWLREQPPERKDAWLAELMRQSGSTIRQQLLAEFRASHPLPDWPTVTGSRTMAELFNAADLLLAKTQQQAAEKSARARAKQLKRIAADPEQALEEVAAPRCASSSRNFARRGCGPSNCQNARSQHTIPTTGREAGWVARCRLSRERGDTMKTIQVYDKPMCCATGVCGPQVDPVLPRFAADLEWLKSQGHHVERFNLAQQPAAFVANTDVHQLLSSAGTECLPVIVVDGRVVSRHGYPSRDMLTLWMAGGSSASVSTTPPVSTMLPVLPVVSDQTAGACCEGQTC